MTCPVDGTRACDPTCSGCKPNALDIEEEILRMEREQFDLPNMMRDFGTDNDPED